ncbi:hypothetical protein [Phaeodactylibacter xiamenensis]|jgi:uncharacterized protein (DUF2164 family)|uniref:hypothetical protein n=1 Tax=Phaeodactylibacter xiamenensis TaxID=1524460 RepID=UPI003CCC24C5
MKDIDLSPLTDEIPALAFNMFRDWNKKALPNEKIHIKNELLLVEDLKAAFRSAIVAIRKKELERTPPGWDVGFIIGFISGSMGVKWYNEYIARNSEQYKILSAVKALSSYFEIKKIELLKVDQLYEHYLKADSNLIIENIEIDKQLFPDDEGRYNDLIEETSANGIVDTILNNIALEQIAQILRDGKNTPNVPVDAYLSNELIEAVLRLNVYNQGG